MLYIYSEFVLSDIFNLPLECVRARTFASQKIASWGGISETLPITKRFSLKHFIQKKL